MSKALVNPVTGCAAIGCFGLVMLLVAIGACWPLLVSLAAIKWIFL